MSGSPVDGILTPVMVTGGGVSSFLVIVTGRGVSSSFQPRKDQIEANIMNV